VENNYPIMVEKFEKTFDGYMTELLLLLTQSRRYETHIANLAERLDFNGFYSRTLLDRGGQPGGVGTDVIDMT